MKKLLTILSLLCIFSCGKDNRTSNSNNTNRQNLNPPSTQIPPEKINQQEIIPKLEVGQVTAISISYESDQLKGSLDYSKDQKKELSIKELTLKNTISTIQKLQIKEASGKIDRKFDYNRVAVEDNQYFQITNWSDQEYFKSKNDLDHFDHKKNLKIEMSLNFSINIENAQKINTLSQIWFEAYYQDKESLEFIKIKAFKLIKNLKEFSVSKNSLDGWTDTFNITLASIELDILRNILKNRHEIFLKVKDFKYIKKNKTYSFKKSLKLLQENRIRYIVSLNNKIQYLYNLDEEDDALMFLSSKGINLDTGFDKDLQAIQIGETIFESNFSKNKFIRELVYDYPDTHIWNLFPGSPITTPKLKLGESLFLSYLTPKNIKKYLRTQESITIDEKIKDNKVLLNDISQGDTYLIEIDGIKNIPFVSSIKSTSQASYHNLEYCTNDDFGTPDGDVGHGRFVVESNSSCTTRASHGWCGFEYRDIYYKQSEYIFTPEDLGNLITIEFNGKKYDLKEIEASLSLTRKNNKLFLKIHITKKLAKIHNEFTIHFKVDNKPKNLTYGFSRYTDCNHRKRGSSFRFASKNSQNQVRKQKLSYKATYTVSIIKTSFKP